jgi:hypothetical protein
MQRSSSKRAHSPAVHVDEPQSKIAQLDGACFGKPSKPEASDDVELPAVKAPPPKPAFLRIKDSGE